MPVLNPIVLIYGVFPIALPIAYPEPFLNLHLWSLGRFQLRCRIPAEGTPQVPNYRAPRSILPIKPKTRASSGAIFGLEYLLHSILVPHRFR
jgi:hypothetical protein